MNRVSRQRVIPWKINWVDRPEGRVAFLGKWRIGEVVRKSANRRVQYVAHLHVPGVNGPIATENTVLAASIRLSEKVKEWLGGLADEAPELQDHATTRTRVRRVK